MILTYDNPEGIGEFGYQFSNNIVVLDPAYWRGCRIGGVCPRRQYEAASAPTG
jgi:hypothetical protein